MQREDVERLCAPIEKIVNYEYSSRDALIHNCDLGAIDMGQLQDLCAAVRALLAERDAAFAAGQAAGQEETLNALMAVAYDDEADVIHGVIDRALTIKDKPDDRQ